MNCRQYWPCRMALSVVWAMAHMQAFVPFIFAKRESLAHNFAPGIFNIKTKNMAKRILLTTIIMAAIVLVAAFEELYQEHYAVGGGAGSVNLMQRNF